MKLRNKKTGEVKEVIVGGYPVSGKTKMWEISEMDCNEESGYKSLGTYNSLAELNAEWEDALEEPKDFWYIRCNGAVKQNGESSLEKHHIDEHKEIGNYFLSREEAEKAVERLRAWKRLKDKGFEIESYSIDIGDNYYKTGQIMLNLNNVMNREWDEYDRVEEIKNELDLLFRR